MLRGRAWPRRLKAVIQSVSGSRPPVNSYNRKSCLRKSVFKFGDDASENSNAFEAIHEIDRPLVPENLYRLV